MARQARLSFPRLPHWLVQRGHSGRPVFVDAEDQRLYLGHLVDSCRLQSVELHALALLPHEIHLLLTPQDASGISQALHRTGSRYSAPFNRRHGRSGTLWDGRFRLAVLAPDRVLAVMAHIELAPERASLCASAGQYGWSSAPVHLGQTGALDWPPGWLSPPPAWWALGNTPFEREAAWRQRLQQAREAGPATTEALERSLRSGVLGDAAFVAELQRQTPRPLTRAPVGRPRRE
ncbi:transposase [Amphibiibacter pelophylacis]|uniref:Transposase n=1 Tax=Amphibiibacter pelophylacis TaxID=1799477 RepID=A0ACC6P251_9BURK